MASSKSRQRKLARAKVDRQLARRAAALRRKRQIQAGVGASLAVLLVVFGAIWLFGGFDGENEPAAAEQCAWSPQNTADNADLKDVGTPPKSGLPETGTRPMTITTNSGTISVALDVTTSKCATASIAYLASKNFFDNTKCHEITTEGALRCGDPSTDPTGLGGPAYSYFSENVPPEPEEQPSPSASPSASPQTPPLYPRGTVALIGNPPGTNGSQFLIFSKDWTTNDPEYSIIGTVTGGLEALDKIVKNGTVDNGSGQQVKPKSDVIIQSLTVGEVVAPTPATPVPAGSGGPATPATTTEQS